MKLLEGIRPDIRFLGDDYRGRTYTGFELNIPIHYLNRDHGWSTTKFKNLICGDSMKIGVCVPYRNREVHLKEFIPTVSKYLESQGIDYHIYFGHQVDDKLFNRGATKNVAARVGIQRRM